MKTTLKLDRETKGTYVYKNENDDAPIPSLYIKKAAIKKFPKHAESLRNAGYFSSSTRYIRDEERSSTVERVELLEAWYRCPDHDDDDEDHVCGGKHVIICEGATLFEEPWPHDFFPFAVLTYDSPNTGAWGNGLVQTIEGYQVSIDKANAKAEEMYDAS